MAKQSNAPILIDANGAIAGRLASFTAKKLLQGESVSIVNAEGAIITGNPRTTTAKYAGRRRIQNKADPEKSAKWPRRPDMLLKKIVKGMLPPQSMARKHALMRLRVYLGIPKDLEGKTFDTATAHKTVHGPHLTLKQLSTELGWHHG